MEESKIVAKVLRSLHASYKHKDATIEEIKNVIDVTKDMFIGNLSTFELSEFGDSLLKVESAFKATVFEKDKQRYDLGKISLRWMSRYEKERKEIEEEEKDLKELKALISKRLPKGADKYEGKLPLKYFSCNKIGHFASKCPESVPKKP